MLRRSHDDPHYFNSVILDRPPYWSGAARGYAGQVEWCRSVVDYRVVCLETGNAVGKDYWVGGIIPWWLYTRRNSLVIATGPGQSILGSVTWKEVRKAIEGCPFDMGARVSKGIKTSPHTVTLGTDWQALGFSTTSVERASGQHNRNLLVIVEEASGVEPETWQAIDSLGYSKLVVIFNPLRPDGGAVEMCDRAAKDRAAGLPARLSAIHHNVPSTAGPDAHKETSEYGMACLTWIEEQKRKYGADSPWYRSHVLAERPKVSAENLIPPEHIDACTSSETRAAVAALRLRLRGLNPRLACDVSEGVGGAMTVIFVLDDLGVLDVHASAFTSASEAAELMVRFGEKHGIPEADWSFDAGGSTGSKLANALRGLGIKRAHRYFGNDPGNLWCTNQRTAAAQAFARRIDPDHYPGADKVRRPFAIPPFPEWERAREELLALRYRMKGDQFALENKDTMVEVLGRSPDFADALTQCFWRAAIVGVK